MAEYLLKCGQTTESPPGEEWKAEAACAMIGCVACQFHKGGKEFYQKDIKRGIAMWAARERKAIQAGERDKDIAQIVEVAKILTGKK